MHLVQRTGTRNGGLGNNYPNYNIVEIGQNTEKSPGDLRRLAVTHTPVKNHQITLMSKTLKELNYNNNNNNNFLPYEQMVYAQPNICPSE